MSHRGPFQPLLFCDSVILRGLWADVCSVRLWQDPAVGRRAHHHRRHVRVSLPGQIR